MYSHEDFSKDDLNIHPPNICSRCHAAIGHFKHGSYGAISFSPIVWTRHTENCSVCSKLKRGGRPKKVRKATGRPKSANSTTVTDLMNWDASKPITPEIDKAVSQILRVKMRQSKKDDGLITVNSGGPQPITLAPITVANKSSENVSSRTLRARSNQTKKLLKITAGDSVDAISKQTNHLVKSFDEEIRKSITSSFKSTISIPEDHVAAMKSTLNLPWNLLRDVRRWLQTFNVKLSSEGRCRDVVKEWTGIGLCVEEIPATVLKNKKLTIDLRPWCYLFNLVGYVLKYLTDLEMAGKLYDHPFIPSDEIHIKIGGDHGGGSFKASFQVGNVMHPNQVDNTVIFSIMEAKDYRSNLVLCLERFKLHINKFNSVLWKGKKFKVFLFGDYEFLCAMYGLSGAAGKYPCLWSIIQRDLLSTPLLERGEFPLRTLVTLDENLNKFKEKYNGNLKNAKMCYNVINSRFFEIPLSQVCIPGLHLTLGIVLKMVRMVENYAIECDFKIASRDASIGDDEYDDSVLVHKRIIKIQEKKIELEESRESLLDAINLAAIMSDIDEDLEESLLDVDDQIKNAEKEVSELRKELKLNCESGPCETAIDPALKSIGVDRQAYYGGTIIGNHCHRILQGNNASVFCKSTSFTIDKEIGRGDLYDDSIEMSLKFEELFAK